MDMELRYDLQKYVQQNLKRAEILDFVKRDYGSYCWSLPTLDRRLRYFQIYYIDHTTSLQQVSNTVEKEVEGPGKLLGYRAMHHKLRIQHGIMVPRHLVHSMMADLDPDGLDARNVHKRLRRKKKPFESDGPLSLVSLDGHDKLCGYQNWTFPLAVYGCLDTFSRKILFLFLSHSNSDPLIIGNKYLAYLTETQILPNTLRVDRGTETGKMASIHVFLRDKMQDLEDPMVSVVFGPSTTNKIERWWRDLHERLEKYFKQHLSELLSSGEYDPHSILDRKLLYYVFKPIIERECAIFVEYWNSHRIREQKDLLLPTGVPHHMFSFPESYGATNKGLHISTAYLREAGEVSVVLKAQMNWLDEAFLKQCEQYIPSPENIDSKNAKYAYCFLKHRIQTQLI